MVLKFGTLNCQSLCNKTEGIVEHFKERNLDVLVLQETFLKQKDEAKIRELKDHGICFVSCPRTTGRERGGLAVIYKPSLKIKIDTKTDTYVSFEHMEMTLQTDEELLRFVNVYRPPYSKGHPYTERAFVLEFEELLEDLMIKPGTPILAGDFNMQMHKPDDRYAQLFQLSLDEVNLQQHVPMIPTHRRGGTLDLIISPEEIACKVKEVQVHDHGTESDHFLVECQLNFTPLHEAKSKTLRYRKYKDIDIQAFKKDLRDSALNHTNFQSIEEATESLDKVLSELMDKHCPVTKKIVKVNAKHSCWFDEELKELRRKRRRLEKRWLKSRDPADKLAFKETRDIMDKLCKEKRVFYHSDSLKKSKDDAKRLWSKINDLLGKTSFVLPDHDEPEVLAESFSAFFSDKVNGIRKKILTEQEYAQINSEDLMVDGSWCEEEEVCDQSESVGGVGQEHARSDDIVKQEYARSDGDVNQRCTQTDECVEQEYAPSNGVEQEYAPSDDVDTSVFCEFEYIDDDELLKLLKGMSKKFCSLDPVPVWLLIECFDELRTVLSYIVNGSLMTGVFPSKYKRALVRPTIKNRSGDKDDLRVYRPVSNLPFMSKVLEKAFLTQMNIHLELNNLHCAAQSGYRPKHSCETLMVRMFNDILTSMEAKRTVALVLLDLSAAFDTVDHDILLKRLKDDYGLGGVVLSWLRSYLRDRTFTVIVGDKTSSPCYIWFGVPQGSILGPVLFILYTKDLSKIAKKHGLIIQLYADDSQLYIGFCPADSSAVNDVIRRIEACLSEIRSWMTLNFMKLNQSKTQVIVLGTNHLLKKVEELSISVGEGEVLSSLKHRGGVVSLGVKLDENLNMKKHIAKVRQSTFYTVSSLGRIKNLLTRDLKLMLVKQLVLSKVDYHNALYANLPDCDIKKLQGVVNAAVRFIYGAGKRVSARPLLIQAHILPVRYRIKFKICLLVFKALHGLSPEYLSLLITYCTPSRGVREDEDETMTTPRRSNDGFLLRQPSYTYKNTILTKRSFSYAGPQYWNDLPYDIRSCDDVMVFKKKLKTHYFTIFVNDPTETV